MENFFFYLSLEGAFNKVQRSLMPITIENKAGSFSLSSYLKTETGYHAFGLTLRVLLSNTVFFLPVKSQGSLHILAILCSAKHFYPGISKTEHGNFPSQKSQVGQVYYKCWVWKRLLKKISENSCFDVHSYWPQNNLAEKSIIW